MKKALSIILTVVILSSIICVYPLSADAVSYKNKMINEILSQDLIESGIKAFYFADLNQDGKLEFIVVDDLQLSQCTVYYMKNSQLRVASGVFSGPRNKLYYDKAKKKYIWNARESQLFRSGIYSCELGNINNTFNYKEGTVTRKMYSGWSSVLVDERTAKRKSNYYKGDLTGKCTKISKSKYKSINKKITKNFINANAKIKLIEIYDFQQASYSYQRKLLEKSYSAFSYKKF